MEPEEGILIVWQPTLFGEGGEYVKHKLVDGQWKEYERGRIADLNE